MKYTIQEIKLTCFWARITHMLKFWSLFRLHTMKNSLDLPIGLTLGGYSKKNAFVLVNTFIIKMII